MIEELITQLQPRKALLRLFNVQTVFIESCIQSQVRSEQDLEIQMEEIRTEQFTLPVLEIKDTQKMTQEALSAGETPTGMARLLERGAARGTA